MSHWLDAEAINQATHGLDSGHTRQILKISTWGMVLYVNGGHFEGHSELNFVALSFGISSLRSIIKL